MNDWVVETPSFEEDLMNNRVVMLNQNGVNRVVEIIKEKDKEIEKLNQYIDFYKDLGEKQNKELQNLKQKVKYYENFEINKTIDKIRIENNKRFKEQQEELESLKQANEDHQNLNGELRVENDRLNNIINESAEEILKELEENHHLSYGVALAIRQKLLDYKELKGDGSSE